MSEVAKFNVLFPQDVLRELIDRFNVNQSELARNADIYPQQLSAFLCWKRDFYSLTIEKILRAMEPEIAVEYHKVFMQHREGKLSPTYYQLVSTRREQFWKTARVDLNRIWIDKDNRLKGD